MVLGAMSCVGRSLLHDRQGSGEPIGETLVDNLQV